MSNQPFTYSPSVWIVPLFLTLLIWFVFLTDHFFNFDLNRFGISPRTYFGLVGIFCSPFLHSDLSHIANNTFPVFIFTMALVYFYRELSLKVLLFGILFSGFSTWIIGRSGNHIGASGLIYVLFSFLFFKGFLTKYYRLMALSFAIVLVYGGMIWYVFPQPAALNANQNISWEGHLSGLLTGFIFAIYYKTPIYCTDKVYAWQHADFDAQSDDFMQHFDSDGNFSPKPKDDLPSSEVVIFPEIIYHFKEKSD